MLRAERILEEAIAYATADHCRTESVWWRDRASYPTADTDDTNMDIGLTDEYKVTQGRICICFREEQSSSFREALH